MLAFQHFALSEVEDCKYRLGSSWQRYTAVARFNSFVLCAYLCLFGKIMGTEMLVW